MRLGTESARNAALSGGIDPSEDVVSIQATHTMRASFAASGFAPAVLKFFDALVTLLTGGERKH